MRSRYLAFIFFIVFVITTLTGCGTRLWSGDTDLKQAERGEAQSEAGDALEVSEEKPETFEGMMDAWRMQAGEAPVVCWYTSEKDKDYMEIAAAAFEQEYGIAVTPVYYDGVQLFEDINRANQNAAGPDVYIMGNDQLEFAVSGGMLMENTAFKDAFWQENYPEAARRALTYRGRQYGYPIYFDTYFLVYDANLLGQAPASIDDILAFADEYEDTGSTKAIFRWDVADPYINTMFIAAYADLFGENGDDMRSFSVNGEKEVAAMEYFQSLSSYLWMDKNNISHDTVKNRIQDGTLVLGLCKSDILPVLRKLHESTTNYQVAYVPSLTAELSSACLSTTYGAFINPYGNNIPAGNMFALYLSYANQSRQYEGNGMLPVINQKDGFDELQKVLYAQYLNAKPVPKTMLLGDYLTESGIVFDAIWEGADVREQLDHLQSVMESKMN